MTPGSHLINQYRDDAGYAENIWTFLEAHLRSGGTALLIVTRNHRDLLMPRVRAASAQDQVKFVDAVAVAKTVFHGGSFQPDQFSSIIESYLQGLRGISSGPILAVGEVVDILWQLGRVNDALAVETVWDEILAASRVRLMCNYFVGRPGRESIPSALMALHGIDAAIISNIPRGRLKP